MLWITSFDWEAFESAQSEDAHCFAEELALEVLCSRESGDGAVYDSLPESEEELLQVLADVVSGRWYQSSDERCWTAIDQLLVEVFRVQGPLAPRLSLKAETNGVLLETHDVACPDQYRASEVYQLGHRRHGFERTQYPEHSNDDPGYSIHSPGQVDQIHRELVECDLTQYPDDEVRENFADSFLAPVARCAAERRGIYAMWS